MGVHPFHERSKPVLRNLDVRVYQNEIFAVDFLESPVVAACKPEISFQFYGSDMREYFFHDFKTVVRGIIICYNDLCAFHLGGRVQKPRKKLPQ